jgi:uncharacterized membrane protein
MSIRSIALLLLLSFVVGAIAYAFVYFYAPGESPGKGYGMGSRLYVLIPIFAVPATFIVGLVVYMILFPEIKQKEPPETSLLKEDESLTNVLRVLKEDERKVVELLVSGDGTMLQRDIGRQAGFSRVKTHRILYRLASRGIVKAERYYNTYRISLAEWLFSKDKEGR